VVGAAGQVAQGLETGAVTACHTGLNKSKLFNREIKRLVRELLHFLIITNKLVLKLLHAFSKKRMAHNCVTDLK
jgi:hypothetical protein